jgi:hypothetical protein
VTPTHLANAESVVNFHELCSWIISKTSIDFWNNFFFVYDCLIRNKIWKKESCRIVDEFLVKNSPFNSSFLQEQTEIFRFKLVKKLLYFLLSYFTTRKKSGVREGTFFNTTAKNHFQLMIFQPIPGFHLLIPFASQLDVWVSDEFSDWIPWQFLLVFLFSSHCG